MLAAIRTASGILVRWDDMARGGRVEGKLGRKPLPDDVDSMCNLAEWRENGRDMDDPSRVI